jgi:hypothetical protein
VPPRTSVLPAAQPLEAAPPSVAPTPAPPPAGRFSYWTESVPATADPEPSEGGSGRRTALVLLAALVVLALLGAGGWLFLAGGPDDDGSSATAGSSSAQPSAAGPEVGAVQEVGGVTFTLEAVKTDDTCVGHAYGDTADFFVSKDCTGLSRVLYSADVNGQPVVVSVARVRLADTGTARDLRSLTDRNGSGNVSDLLREGVRYTGSPAELSGAEYASAVSGPTVTIVESAWVDRDAKGNAADIDRMADAGLSLQTPPFPVG